MKTVIKSIVLFSCFLMAITAKAQPGGAIWIGSRTKTTVEMPAKHKGAESAATKTFTDKFEKNGVKGTATLRYNPDGKIVSFEITPDMPMSINRANLDKVDLDQCLKGCPHMPNPAACVLHCLIWSI